MKTWIVIKILIARVAVSALCTLLMATRYATVQQHIRLAANVGPAGVAQDVIMDLNNGISPEAIAKQYRNFQVAESIRPFAAIFDASGVALASSIHMSGGLPQIAWWVFENALKNGENRIAREPQEWFRFAIVIKYNAPSNQFALGGKSLVEEENLISTISSLSFIGRIISIALSMCLVIVFYFLAKQESKE